MNIIQQHYRFLLARFFFLLLPCWLSAQDVQKDSFYLKKYHHTISLLGDDFNSGGDDMAGFRYASKLYFTKSVETGGGSYVSRIFSLNDKGHLVAFEKNPVEDGVHVANPALTVTGDRIYYNVYNEGESGNKLNSQIRFRDRDFNGNWGPEKKLPRFKNLVGVNLSNPATGILRDSRSAILFFVADHEKGSGQQDIWGCFVKNDGNFSKPFKLPFNTPADEIAPFFDAESQTLYFSSNSPLSFGGFDIFRSHYMTDGKWSTPENLGRPINSYYNDAFFSLHNNGLHNYFSTDRPHDHCPQINEKCRGMDIFEVELKPTLQLFLFDDFDKNPLKGCNIELMETSTNTVVSTYLNLSGNIATVGLDQNKKYQLIISKPNYRPVFEEITAEGMNLFKINYLELRLSPMQVKSVSAKNEYLSGNNKLKLNQTKKIIQEKKDTAIIAYAELKNDETKNITEFPEKNKAALVNQAFEKQNIEDKIGPTKSVQTNDHEKAEKIIETKTALSEKNSTRTENKPEVKSITNETEGKTNFAATTDNSTLNRPAEKLLENKVEELFFSLDSTHLIQIKNRPNISLSKHEDPIDLLFFHKRLNCTIAIDLKSKNFEPDDVHFMNRYLKSIEGLYKKDQEPSIGITFFNGSESQFVIYTFRDSNTSSGTTNFINTFLFPEHYRNVIPDPTSLVKLSK